MNKLRFIFPILIQINIVVAVLSIVFVVIMREQQAQLTVSTQDSADPDSNSLKLKAKIVDYQAKIRQNHQKIQGYEQQLKGLEAELKEYKIQNALLMRVNPSKSPNLTTAVLLPSSSQKTTSVKDTSNPSVDKSTQPKEEINNLYSTLESTTIDPFSIVNSENIEREEIAVNPENENRLNDNNNDMIFVAQNTSFLENLTNSSKVNSEPVPKITERPLLSDDERDKKIYEANTIAFGLAIAVDQGTITDGNHLYKIKHGNHLHRKVNTAIKVLRKGKTIEEAIHIAKVPEPFIKELVKLGEQRPAALLKAAKEQ